MFDQNVHELVELNDLNLVKVQMSSSLNVRFYIKIYPDCSLLKATAILLEASKNTVCVKLRKTFPQIVSFHWFYICF